MATGGYRLGDIIIGIDDKEIKDYKELFEVLDSKKVGQTVKLKIIRDDGIIEVPTTLEQSVPARSDN